MIISDTEPLQYIPSGSASEVSPSLSPSLSPPDLVERPQYQLPSSPKTVHFAIDLPDSPKSSNGNLSSDEDKSSSCDSATLTTCTTDMSIQSSSLSLSQPEPKLTSSPVSVHPEPHEQSEPDEHPENSKPPRTPGVKLVIDNIDKTVHLRYQRVDAQSKSLHYIQVYAVKDWVDFSKLSNSPPPDGQSVYNVLPTMSDYQVLKDNFVVLVSRTLVEYIPFFSQDFKGLVEAHIPHQHSSLMTNKSDVVSYHILIMTSKILLST